MITFVTPPPGLTSRRFELLREDGSDGVYTLASLDEPGVSLLTLSPAPWVPDYRPSIPVGDLDAIGSRGTDPLVLLVAGARGGQVTVNLMAPILVNPDSGAATQSILEGQNLTVARVLEPAA